jgi:DNA polymerase III subunit beta
MIPGTSTALWGSDRMLEATVRSLDFAAGLALVRRATGKPTDQTPLLGHVYVSPRDDRRALRLTATNYELAVSVTVAAEVGDWDAICLPAQVLGDWAGSLRDVPVRLVADGDNAVVRLNAGTHRTWVNGLGVEEFPPLPRVDGDVIASVDAAEFAEAVGQVAVCASTDPNAYPVLTGVLIECQGQRLTLAATNGHWLAERHLDLDGETDAQTIRVIVSAKHLREVARAVNDDRVRVQILRGEVAGHGLLAGVTNHLVFQVGDDVVISARLIEGEYPNYRVVIPTSWRTHVSAPRVPFATTVRTASVVVGGKEGVLRLLAGEPETPGGPVLELWSELPEIAGDETTVLGAEARGPVVDVWYAARYIGGALDAIRDDSVELALNGPLQPGVIRPGGRDDLLYVVMPLSPIEGAPAWGRRGH